MKKIFALSLFILGSLVTFAQDFSELRILYADGDYEKLVVKAENYTQKDDSKKWPEPYMWMSRGLYKISLSGEADEKYKNAFKDAIKMMQKFLKYDKDGSVLDGNTEFQDFLFKELQPALFESILNEVISDNFQKAFSWVLKYPKVSNNTIGAKYLEGCCRYSSGDKGSAFTAWRDADAMLKELTSIDDYSDTDYKIFRLGVTETAEFYVSMLQQDKAKDLLNRTAQWFEGDEEFQAVYDEIVN